MVARCWECDRVPPPWKHREQDAGDHKGPPHLSSPPSPLRKPGVAAEWVDGEISDHAERAGASITLNMSRKPSISRSVSSRVLDAGITMRTTCTNPLNASSNALISCCVSQIGVSSSWREAVNSATSRRWRPSSVRSCVSLAPGRRQYRLAQVGQVPGQHAQQRLDIAQPNAHLWHLVPLIGQYTLHRSPSFLGACCR